MHLSQLEIENFRVFGEGEDKFVLDLKSGLTALVGENDSGKTAVIDALRFALGTTDQEWSRIEISDFHRSDVAREIRIVCRFECLNDADKRVFVEFLSYDRDGGTEPVLYVQWAVKDTGQERRGRPYRRVTMHSGKDGDGPEISQECRAFLQATYLRPLRDARRALSAGRGSRLAQVLQQTDGVKEGKKSHRSGDPLDHDALTVVGIARLLSDLLTEQEGVKGSRSEIDKRLQSLILAADHVPSDISVSGHDASDDVVCRALLEKLDLEVKGPGQAGLGTDNLLFMACELLLLAQDRDEAGNRLLLIEEPEAHLHAQRQLRVMEYLQKRAEDEGIQVIVTTHSPNLASAIDLERMVVIHDGRAYSMASDKTKLSKSDYGFLQRFLDVTKANLFFARGVLIVEGPAENILLPTLARLIGRDLTEHGVSIVNVGGTGLGRYARIFQRTQDGEMLKVPVACVTDMDVMPNCAPEILGLEKKKDRRWRTKQDLDEDGKTLDDHRKEKQQDDDEYVQTFVSDHWTLEYDLALAGQGWQARRVYTAACLAQEDESICKGNKANQEVIDKARKQFADMEAELSEHDGSTKEEVTATKVYKMFHSRKASKPIAAQHLAACLHEGKGNHTFEEWRERLPKYLVDAIDHVTGGNNTGEDDAGNEEGDCGE